MSQVRKFIKRMKSQYELTDAEVLQAVQDEPQHDFIMTTMGVNVETATQIIEDAEDLLLCAVDSVRGE